jgi:hypothetical protein
VQVRDFKGVRRRENNHYNRAQKRITILLFMPAADIPCLTPTQFTSLLVTQLPVYSKQILRDIRPTDGFLGHISTGQWDPFSGPTQTQDRFRSVEANVTQAWEDVVDAECAGAPCDPIENELCWGWDRIVYGQKRQSWRGQMMCFDKMILATKAVEHIGQLVSDVLRPATSAVGSYFVRKESLRLGTKRLANATMSPFTLTWEKDGNQEIYATPSAFPTSLLTPEMIQRQLPKMRGVGYFGKWTNDPFWGGYNELAELITDDETAWSMDRVATNQRLGDAFRFQQWTAAHEYYKFGMGGQIGNFMVHIDPRPMRFNRVGNKLQVVLPYRNDPAFVGIGSNWNDDYDNAQYQISYIWHRFAWELQVAQMQSVHPSMPFIVRGLNGQWNFAVDNLGQDCAGNAIANYRKNKGFFWADFQYGSVPKYTEFLTAILHLRQPMVTYVVAPCAADPGYPEQNYNSACDGCDTTYRWTPRANGAGNYVLAANSVTCGENPIDNGAISAATLAALVTALNGDTALGAIGTWSTSGGQLILTDATCEPVLPWVV